MADLSSSKHELQVKADLSSSKQELQVKADLSSSKQDYERLESESELWLFLKKRGVINHQEIQTAVQTIERIPLDECGIRSIADSGGAKFEHFKQLITDNLSVASKSRGKHAIALDDVRLEGSWGFVKNPAVLGGGRWIVELFELRTSPVLMEDTHGKNPAAEMYSVSIAVSRLDLDVSFQRQFYNSLIMPLLLGFEELPHHGAITSVARKLMRKDVERKWGEIRKIEREPSMTTSTNSSTTATNMNAATRTTATNDEHRGQTMNNDDRNKRRPQQTTNSTTTATNNDDRNKHGGCDNDDTTATSMNTVDRMTRSTTATNSSTAVDRNTS